MNTRWQIGNNSDGPDSRKWFVLRTTTGRWVAEEMRFHESRGGVIIRYATPEAAQRKADRLNKEDGL
jgi:hypothetical protein